MESTLKKPKRNPKKTTLYKENFVKPLYHGLEIALDDFLEWKPEIIDNWKNEWKNNKIESIKQRMDKKHWYIQKIIERAFIKTRYFQEGNDLLSEAKIILEDTNTVRIPDLAYFTNQQIIDGKNGLNPVPAFIIEIVSTFDQLNSYEQKLREYFQCGVQCVWLIFPIYKEVKVYTSIRNCMICLENDLCSASPALHEFELICDKIFE